MNESNLELTILRGSGPIVTEQYSRGGALLRDDGVSECTMGWSVTGTDGDGFITAAHCSGINQLRDHVNGYIYTTQWRDHEYGSGGDVEYHTTPGSAELDDFHASSTVLRDVSGIRSTASMVGNSVCVYGRFSNVRTCNHSVQAVNITVGTIGNLARTNSTSTIGGDSGGGWSWNNTAWGVHRAMDGSGRGYFTPAQAAEAALNVTIMR